MTESGPEHGTRAWAVETDASDLYQGDDPLAFDDVGDETQPALSRLALDVRDYRRQLVAGFDSRREILEWSVGATGATLGRLPREWSITLHESMITDTRTDERPPLVGALLGVDGAVPRGTGRELRQRIAAETFSPAASRAVTTLREDAQEVAPSREGPSINPEREQHSAMRPSLSQIEEHQRRAISALLDGFDGLEQLLAWGDVLDLATHGEIPDDYVSSLATDPTTTRLLVVDESETHREPREVMAAWLLRYFRDGTRSRYDHSAEVSDPKSDDDRATSL
jgi:hypothetical protein